VPEPLELRGRPASPGLAAGPLIRLDAAPVAPSAAGDVIEEEARLAEAIAAAVTQIESLMQAGDEESAAILEFQSAMLADPELVAPAIEAIVAGASAASAWQQALALQTEIYGTADDDYFRARLADLEDLRDRVLRNLAGGSAAETPSGAILVGRDVTPTRFLETDWSQGGGLALAGGSARSHVAMLARSRGVPMVVGLGDTPLDGHAEALVDGASGLVVLSPGAAEQEAFANRRAAVPAATLDPAALRAPAVTADGVPIRVLVNVARPADVETIDVATCDGVGLMRSEFLFTAGLPDEERQLEAYAKVLRWAAGRPVVIRTIDAGGDKPVAGLTVDEQNPFLGLRGIRLSLARPEIFKVQLRALARAAILGNLKVMLPMVSVPHEIAAAAALLDEAVAELAADGVPAARPPLGIMVEVPAVAIAPELYGSAAFFSIGSNDLTQYVMAASRDSEHVQELNDPSHPAVLQLIANTAAYGARTGREVSLCGDAGSDPALVPLLLKAGLRSLSVVPTALGAVKAAIAATRIADAR
jgi:phosphotransferase system enzyme I (PtsI)